VARNEGPPDQDLLEQFLGGAESESEDAFRILVARHGRMIRRICRRVLDHDADAEDACQATFLVLVRRGASIRDRGALVGWLREVAYRIAIKVRDRARRRRVVERRGAALAPTRIEPDNQGQQATRNELRPIVLEELVRLPDTYRLPVVLSYLEGKTNEEVATLLQWPVGTVKGRLARARELLRSRLGRRGVTLSAAMLVTALAACWTRPGEAADAPPSAVRGAARAPEWERPPGSSGRSGAPRSGSHLDRSDRAGDNYFFGLNPGSSGGVVMPIRTGGLDGTAAVTTRIV